MSRWITIIIIFLSGLALGVDETLNRDLLNAAETGNAEDIRHWLGAGADVNAATPSGVTALMMAAFGGHEDVVRLLLVNGAKVNIQSENGVTALISAAKKGHQAVVELLLEKSSRTDMTTDHGLTAAEVAEAEGHSDLAQLIRTEGLKKETESKTEDRPLPEDDTFEVTSFSYEITRKKDPSWQFSCRITVRNKLERPIGLSITFQCIDDMERPVDNYTKKDVFINSLKTKVLTVVVNVSSLSAFKITDIRPIVKSKATPYMF